MSSGVPRPRGVQLVGSVPLGNAEEVFRVVGASIGRHLRRIPDGETGERTFWVAFQYAMLARNPAFEGRGAGLMRVMLGGYSRSRVFRRVVNGLVARRAASERGGASLLRVRAGVKSADIRLGPLGYAAAATESFAAFSRLKHAGVLPGHLRFQVSMPTPVAVANAFPPHQQPLVLPAYEARLGQEIDDMLSVIPTDQLAIQWDAALEFAIMEGVAPSAYGSPAASRLPLLDTLVRLGRRVPDQVELGYHLCYGDAGHKHFKEPENAARLTDAANFVASGVGRRLNWIHFPVPIARSDDAYFEPLRELRLADETELYAGVVHLTDGVVGTRRRIEAASRAMPREFGIATECGFGRRDPHTVAELLRLHAQMAAPVYDEVFA